MRHTAREGPQPEQSDQPGVEAEDVRTALARILASDDFDASERNRRFLSFIVEETLAGRGERIKGYGIALAVFDRDDTFDPQGDPIVRIEASRLRRSLERYYLMAGRDDPIRIEIPKGGYVPVFQRQEGALGPPSPPAPEVLPPVAGPEPAAALSPGEEPEIPAVPAPAPWLRLERSPPHTLLAALALLGAVALGGLALELSSGEPEALPDEAVQIASFRQGPAILVAQFEDDSAEPAPFNLSRGFTREVIAGLTRFDDLFVFGPETTFRHGVAADPQDVAATLGVDFILRGGVMASADSFAVTAMLMDAKSGQYLWSGQFDGSLAPDAIIQVRNHLADQVARTLAQPYGVIYQSKSAEIQDEHPQFLTSYGCVLRFHDYWRTYDFAQYESIRQCLERAITVDPFYADAYASLSIIYTDAYRFDLRPEAIKFDPLARALELGQRAVELAPGASRGYQALHLAYWLMNDVQRSLEAGERGLALNPNDTGTMADLGLRYCLRAQWDKGLPLVQEAYARNPGQPGQYRIALFLHHYVNGRYAEALAEASRIDAPEVIYNHLALAMAYGQLGHEREARAAVARMLAIDPAYGDRVVPDLQKRNVDPALIKVVVEGLSKAGLKIDARWLASAT
jgi:adenylate cyclase